MGGIESNNNFFNNEFGGLADAFKAFGKKIEGHDDEAKMLWENARIGVNNAFGGTPQSRILSTQEKQDVLVKQQHDNLIRAQDPNQSWNLSNWKSVSGKVSNVSYSGQSSIGGAVKPSDLMSISDPNTKIINSTVRGSASTLWGIGKDHMDTAASGSIATATVGNPVSSDTINAGGGTGPTISQDASNQGVSGSGGGSQSISSHNT